MSEWTVRGEKDNGDVVERDATSRSDAEATKAQAEDLGLTNVEIIAPDDAASDDAYLLAELAETRAMKRAVAWASGVGMTAASEMMGSL